MKNQHLFLATLSLAVLIWTQAAAQTPDQNIALNQPVVASGHYQDLVPANAFDGDESSYWNSGGGAGNWIEVDLGREVPVGAIRMMTAQSAVGTTHHVVTGRTESGETLPLWTSLQYTINLQWLENFSIEQGEPVRYIRVTTLSAISWVAWVEIEVYEGDVVATEEMTLSAIKTLYR